MVTIFPLQVFAAESAKEIEAKKESAQISGKIDKTLQQANEKYREIESLQTDVKETQNKIKETQASIKTTENSIKKRTDAMGSRMKNIQINESSFNLFDTLMNADSFSDFVSRLHAVTVIQDAERMKVETLASDKEKLEKLQADLATNQQSLVTQEESLAQEKQELDKDVATLKKELADNQGLLETLSKDRIVKEAMEKKAQADKEKAKKQHQAAKEAEANKVVAATTNADKQAESNSQTSQEPKQPEMTTSTSGGGRTMMMESTAYSYSEAGLTPFTATGLDLRENPNAIAVDPSVIPLGSIVEVSGYGLAIAADTGGAIKGNIIDVHFPTVEQCYQWGRRQVSVTIK
ncbi:hypothetical protein CBF34_00240 [Vagococcus penaei]|nr:3D domain-containing protein [Vagococcus penaei]RSU07584.1 hypothetical protein CBF34_00240 [Vagococcus penaei]